MALSSDIRQSVSAIVGAVGVEQRIWNFEWLSEALGIPTRTAMLAEVSRRCGRGGGAGDPD